MLRTGGKRSHAAFLLQRKPRKHLSVNSLVAHPENEAAPLLRLHYIRQRQQKTPRAFSIHAREYTSAISYT